MTKIKSFLSIIATIATLAYSSVGHTIPYHPGPYLSYDHCYESLYSQAYYYHMTYLPSCESDTCQAWIAAISNDFAIMTCGYGRFTGLYY